MEEVVAVVMVFNPYQLIQNLRNIFNVEEQLVLVNANSSLIESGRLLLMDVIMTLKNSALRSMFTTGMPDLPMM